MNRAMLAVDITKSVVQCCEQAKWEFRQMVVKYFEERNSVESEEEVQKKRKIEESEEEVQYTSSGFESFTGMMAEKLERKVSSEESEGEEINGIEELEGLITELKAVRIEKKDMERISRFLDEYPRMGLAERNSLKKALEKFDGLKVNKEDSQTWTVFSEVTAKVRKIFSKTLIDEDWENIEVILKDAIRENNKEKIVNIVKRINNAFPDDLNERIKEELTGVRKLLMKVVDRGEVSETQMKVVNILKKLGNGGGEKKNRDVEKIAKQFDFESSEKKLINTVEAFKTVPARKRR